MKFTLFTLLIIGLTAGTAFCQVNQFDTTKLYPAEALRADFRFLRNMLQKTHPNLYLYTSRNKMNAFFDSLNQSITGPRTLFNFYNLVTLLNDKIKDGHTIMLPPEEASAYFRASCKFLPFYFIVVNNRLFVRMNCSSDTLIKSGIEIISINNIPASGIVSNLVKRQIRDGYSEAYPQWILSNYFKEYYGFHFGHPDSFYISYKNRDASFTTSVIRALPRDSINLLQKERYQDKKPKEGQGITLAFDTIAHSAILTIRSLDSELLKTVYNQEYIPVFDSLFMVLHNYKTNRVILDMRDNQGGDFECGRRLLSFLVNQPLDYLPGSKEYERIKPNLLHYNGPLIVLVNGGTFSNAAIVSAYLQHDRKASIIGEESAGNKTILSGDPVEVTLPNTKIIVEISSTKYIIKNRPNDGHGIIPNHKITPSVEDIIMNRDVVKDYALKLE